MTLNITLVTAWGIHQSADFRLVDLNTMTSLSESSAKIVQVRYKDWLGVITYCGIGRWKSLDTNEWLSKWLSHNFGEQRSFKEVLEIICKNSEIWMREIETAIHQSYPHTFTIAGFVNQKAAIAVISNFEQLNTNLQKRPSSKFTISVQSVGKIKLVISGRPNAVSNEDKNLLKAVGKHSSDFIEIQRTLALVNEHAAEADREAISKSCWTYSLLPDGSASGRYFGLPQGKLIPIILNDGVDFISQLHLIPAPGRQIQMGSMTTVTSESMASKGHTPCIPSIVHPDYSNNIHEIKIIDLGSFGGINSRATAINKNGIAVGESSIPLNELIHGFVRPKSELIDLGTLGGTLSFAKGINSTESVIGNSFNPNNQGRAFIWNAKDGLRNLGDIADYHIDASAINSHDQVVGSCKPIIGDLMNIKEDAFIWTEQKGFTFLGSLDKGWSRAIDINDNGEIIGISPVGGFTRALIWSETAGMAEIGTLGGDCSEPMAINNLGQVIGLSETPALENRPFIWSRELGIRELPILGNVIPRDINNLSEIILDIETPLGMRSFLWVDADKLIQQLPWYERHNTQAFCINDNREIAGQIFGNDGHSHAILWKVES